MSRALVLSAETPSACATVRGLHAAGFAVTALAADFLSPAGLSWRCDATHHAPDWRAADLPRLVRELRADVVVPVTEGDLLRLAPVRAEVEALVPVVAPPADALVAAMDKARVADVAQAAGVAVPDTRVFADQALPDDFDGRLPGVAKPALSRTVQEDGSVWAGTARYVAAREDLASVRAEHAAAGTATLLQRPVAEGRAILVSLLAGAGGEHHLLFAHERIREMRPEGGPSACAISTIPDAALTDAAWRMAQDLGLTGAPAQFEFRVGADGRAVLLDVNPRPWGTLGLALDCGVNFYGLCARHALGAPLPAELPPYRTAVARHYLPFELYRSWTVLFGSPQPGYTGVWPSRASALTSWVALPHAGLVFRLDDPLPAAGDALRLLLRALRR